MVEYHSTPPIRRSFGLPLSGTSYRFLPHTVPSSRGLSFPPPTTPSLRDTPLASSVIPRVRLVRVGSPPPFSQYHPFRDISCGLQAWLLPQTPLVLGELAEIATGLRHYLHNCSESPTVSHDSCGATKPVRSESGVIGKARES